MPTFDLSQGWAVTGSAADSLSRLAAAELTAAFSRLAPGRGGTGPVRVDLSHDGGDGEGYRWDAAASGAIALRGDSPRGLLWGACDLLHAAGIRWLPPGAAVFLDRFPAGPVIQVPARRASSPALPGRCLIIGHEVFLRQAEEWIAWAGRNRLNTIFFHVIDEPIAMGAAHARRYRARREKAVAACRERGMRIEVGGHGMSQLLPRRYFRTVPQAFRMSKGARTPVHNFCPSSPEARSIVSANAAALFRLYPEADVVHCWADDIPGGGWCSCPRCAGLSVSDQALMATNILADALQETRPGAQISHLAYQDTENVPRVVTPRPNVCLLWAPRMRCYAHGAEEAGCRQNELHSGASFRALDAFFRRSGAQPSRVFEYYLDTILFPAALPLLPTTMAKDMRFYRDAGAHTVQVLATGSTPPGFPQANAWLFPRLAWDPEEDAVGQAAEMMLAALGADPTPTRDGAAHARLLVESLETAHAASIDIVPEQLKLRLSTGPLAAVNDPWADMTDPAHAPGPVLREKVRALDAVPELLARAKESLDAMRDSSAPDRWEAAETELRLHGAVLLFARARAKLYEAGSRGAPAEERGLLAEARGHFRDVKRWARRTMTVPADRRGLILFLEGIWGLRLAWISRTLALTSAGRGLSFCLSAGRLAGRYIRVRLGSLR